MDADYPRSGHRRGDPERLVHTNEQTRVERGPVRWLCRQWHGRSLHGLERWHRNTTSVHENVVPLSSKFVLLIITILK